MCVTQEGWRRTYRELVDEVPAHFLRDEAGDATLSHNLWQLSSVTKCVRQPELNKKQREECQSYMFNMLNPVKTYLNVSNTILPFFLTKVHCTGEIKNIKLQHLLLFVLAHSFPLIQLIYKGYKASLWVVFNDIDCNLTLSSWQNLQQ